MQTVSRMANREYAHPWVDGPFVASLATLNKISLLSPPPVQWLRWVGLLWTLLGMLPSELGEIGMFYFGNKKQNLAFLV
jgi:hypothetical protein